ncbi:NAD(+)/NADH kinase [bacterium]|nr:NAD(+)/NADH kinase [bacterium]
MYEKIGIIAKPRGESVEKIVSEVCTWLIDRGKQIIVDHDTAKLVCKPISIKFKADIPSEVDLILVLGGDGTLISVARLIGESCIPIVAVNLGHLGFLTEVTIQEMYRVLENVFSGDFDVSQRMLLVTHLYRKGERIVSYNVLNDAVINKSALARIIELETWVDGVFLTRYRADGLIVSTPTGSTAYSLSAGGPILFPTLESIILSPICPHTLTHRPIVLPASVSVEVILSSSDVDVTLTLDGQVGFILKEGDLVKIKKAASYIHLIHPKDKDYFTVWREKLAWGQK